MRNNRFIAYYRVSTQRQGQSGLGLDAQRAAVSSFLNGQTLVAEFKEIETGKGSDALDRRPALKAAMDQCKRQSATLVIAKLDRLARNVHFIAGLIESGVEFIAADMPQATKTTLQIYAVMAEHERDQISARTKAALAQAKQRGVVLGVAGPRNLRPNLEARQQTANAFASRMRELVAGFQLQGLSQRQMANKLNQLQVRTPAGSEWRLIQIQRLIARLKVLQAN